MKCRTAIALTLSLASLGCVPADSSRHELADAIPNPAELQAHLPTDEGARATALGELSEFYAMTHGAVQEFNGATDILVVIHLITQAPPTSVEGNTATWGPGSEPLDPADYRVRVTYDEESNSYSWVLDGRSKFDDSGEFLAVVSGVDYPSGVEHQSMGEFALNVDNMKALDPIQHGEAGSGSATVIYDTAFHDGSEKSIEVHIDATDGDGTPIVLDYRYAENLDQSGDLQFTISTDIDHDGSAFEEVTLRSRWLADGSGRGDARMSGGDLDDNIVEVSQCWDDSFDTVYEVSTHDVIPEAGDSEACAFEDVSLPDL